MPIAIMIQIVVVVMVVHTLRLRLRVQMRWRLGRSIHHVGRVVGLGVPQSLRLCKNAGSVFRGLTAVVVHVQALIVLVSHFGAALPLLAHRYIPGRHSVLFRVFCFSADVRMGLSVQNLALQ